MNEVRLVTVSILTSGAGAFTTKTPEINGSLLQMRYVVDGTSPLPNTADLSIAGTQTGISYFSTGDVGGSSFTKEIRQATHDTAGAASLYAAGGEPVEAEMAVAEQLTVTVANGGDTKIGTLYLWIG